MRLSRWVKRDFFGVFKEIRLSYIPPLMVYLAAGVSGFTGIVESFYVKDELGLSAAFLASLGFWAGLPWALKMPLGHLVDLYWKHKSFFVYLGALLMAGSLLIFVGLTGSPNKLTALAPAEVWYVIATLLTPIGFVLQDVVADAMTVEAVPVSTPDGQPIADAELQRMHITMQTLGRIAIIGGSAMVAGIGGWLANILSYKVMFQVALIIPVISVAGVVGGALHQQHQKREMRRKGISNKQIQEAFFEQEGQQSPDWLILGGSLFFVIISLFLGLSDFSLKKEAVFFASFGVISFLMYQIIKPLSREKKREIIGIAAIIFVFRTMPGIGAGGSWWQIDVLGFDESFFGTLRQIASLLAILGLLVLRGWMTSHPIPYIIVFLSLYNGVMMLPFIGMYHGLHLWTEEVFGFGARTIAIIDTMADSPLNQVVMVPMLAWIAREAPKAKKATYFAVMAAFTNLALSGSNLMTSYVNRIFVVARGDYSELGTLMVAVALIVVTVPLFAVFVINIWQNRRPS